MFNLGIQPIFIQAELEDIKIGSTVIYSFGLVKLNSEILYDRFKILSAFNKSSSRLVWDQI